MGLNTILLSDLESGGRKTSVPLHQDWNSAQIRQRLHVSTGTSKCGTGTKSVLVPHFMWVPIPVYLVPIPLPHCMWVPVPVSVVPIPLPLQLLLFTVALPGASRQRLSSSAMIYICSLDTNLYKNVHETRKTCTNTKTRETIKGTYPYTK